jgi:hypothetical protein
MSAMGSDLKQWLTRQKEELGEPETRLSPYHDSEADFAPQSASPALSRPSVPPPDYKEDRYLWHEDGKEDYPQMDLQPQMPKVTKEFARELSLKLLAVAIEEEEKEEIEKAAGFWDERNPKQMNVTGTSPCSYCGSENTEFFPFDGVYSDRIMCHNCNKFKRVKLENDQHIKRYDALRRNEAGFWDEPNPKQMGLGGRNKYDPCPQCGSPDHTVDAFEQAYNMGEVRADGAPRRMCEKCGWEGNSNFDLENVKEAGFWDKKNDDQGEMLDDNRSCPQCGADSRRWDYMETFQSDPFGPITWDCKLCDWKGLTEELAWNYEITPVLKQSGFWDKPNRLQTGFEECNGVKCPNMVLRPESVEDEWCQECQDFMKANPNYRSNPYRFEVDDWLSKQAGFWDEENPSQKQIATQSLCPDCTSAIHYQGNNVFVCDKECGWSGDAWSNELPEQFVEGKDPKRVDRWGVDLDAVDELQVLLDAAAAEENQREAGFWDEPNEDQNSLIEQQWQGDDSKYLWAETKCPACKSVAIMRRDDTAFGRDPYCTNKDCQWWNGVGIEDSLKIIRDEGNWKPTPKVGTDEKPESDYEKAKRHWYDGVWAEVEPTEGDGRNDDAITEVD